MTRIARNHRRKLLLALMLCSSASLGCEPPQFRFRDQATTSDLDGTWKLDYTGKRLFNLDHRTPVDGVGVETLEIFADGDYTQSFSAPNGFTYHVAGRAWSAIEDEVEGPLVRMEGMMPFCYGVASVESGRTKAVTVELILLPMSNRLFGKAEGWRLCYVSSELELYFTKTK